MHTRLRISELAMKARMLVIAGLLLLLAAPAAFASPWAVNFIAGPNGSISGDVNQTVPDFGSTTAVTAVPNSGYHFVNWTGTGGFVTTTANPLIVSGVTTSMDITANFNVGPATMTLPDYSMPLLTPASQEATAWTNVIPNALAAYYTYVPYSNLDAENLGFPPTCGNPNLPGAMQNDLDSTEDCYTITVKKFQQQLAIPDIFGGGSGLLNPATGLPFGAVTQVYGYGSGGVGWTPPAGLDIVTGNAPAPFVDGTYGTTGIWHFPAPTIRGKNGRPIRIQWLNELPNEAPVGFDPTVDCGPNAPDCYPYNRIVTHVHGAHVPDDSDGYAAAWFTPNFALTGPGWLASTYGPQGTYRYPMDQEAATIWYHDHAMGTTHTNTQMGLAGFFPITDANEQALIAANILPTGAYELGFALQDRMFDTNGQFAMPDYPVYDLFSMTTNTITGCTLTVDGLADPATCTRLDWMKDPADGHLVPYVQGHPFLTHPSGINAGAPFPAAGTTLEYFGNMPVVNGVTYGKYDVEPRVYRMRFIGGTDSRTWVMQLVTRGTGTVIPFWQIGSEQGFLNNPVPRDTMDLMPGERLDVLVDLTGIPPGTKIVMQNIGPDSPYGGPATLLDPAYVPSVDIPEILEFNVIGLSGPDAIMTPSFGTNLRPVSGAIAPLVPTPGTPVRKIALEEIVDQYGRTMPTIDQRGFMQMGVPATEVVRLNDTEEWDLINTTVDAHPMHLHLVQFQVVSRQTFTSFVSAVTDTVTGSFGQPSYTSTGFATTATSNLQGVEPWEAGWKDTVDCPPGLVTTIKAKFDIAGDKYVYHCHILSHEEHDMMRPLVVAAPLTVNFIAGTGGSVVGTLNQSVPYLASATTVTAVPNAGYHFVNWTGNGGFVTTGSNPLTVTNVTAAMDITANFEIDTYAVNFSAGPNGSISGTANQTVAYLASASTVTALPNAGYHFVNWTGTGGFVTIGSNPLTVEYVTAAMDITANFALGSPTVSLPAEYSMALLTPDSQVATAWTNVIPNALASYYTYVPYSSADAVALGFPSSCGNPEKGTPADLASTEDCYTITVKSFVQQLAIPGIFGGGSGLLDQNGIAFGAATRAYGYGSGGVNWTPPNASVSVTGNAPAPFVDGTFGTTGIWHFPAPTIRGTKGRPIRIQWLNELPNEMPSGFDPTVDCGPNAPDCFPYNRIVTHVHGAHVPDDSDGYAPAWFTPNFALKGPGWAPSTHGPEGTYRYPMDQEAATIWYHDHAMGVTHNNTQMGLAGFFPITDANEQALIAANILPTGAYELGFALQDRMFDTNGQFAMPDAPVIDAAFPACDPTNGTTRLATCSPLFMKAADGHLIPYDLPTMVDPSGINLDAPFLAASTSLEYFGNMPVVNGVTYGKYDVEPRVYRMRFIGGTDSRTWVMQLVTRGTGTVIPFWQIGSEQGFLDNPVPRDTMDLLPGERLDVLVDLTGIPAGTKIVMKNIGPDMPYGGPDTLLDPLYEPSVDIPEIMEFDVIGLTGSDAITTPSAATNLRPVSGAIVPLVPTPGTPIRNVSLVEGIDQYGRTMPSIDGRGFMQMGVPITEVIRLNDTEEWNIINDTVDAHPIHLHLVAFQVVSRQTYTNFVPAVTDTMAGTFTQPQFTGTGPLLPPAAWEAGWKDTVDCPPGTVTTVRAKFDIAGSRYVWHCHILSHEEHDMMRPMAVVAPSAPVSNILWRNTATGDNAVWNMTGTAMTGSAFLTPLNDPNWKIVGTADFNADGTPDLLWRNTVTGENAVWYMTGTTMTGSAFLPPMYDLNWNIVGTADFNANGMPDLLWRNTVTGDNAVWYMNGATMTGSAFLTPLNDPNWNIVGTADFNADGTPDLFWRNNTTGDNAVWYITGTTMTGSAFLSPLYDLNWNIVGVGDYNADGTPDLFWRNSTTGDNAVWYMTGTTMTGSAFLTPLYDPNWRIVGLQ